MNGHGKSLGRTRRTPSTTHASSTTSNPTCGLRSFHFFEYVINVLGCFRAAAVQGGLALLGNGELPDQLNGGDIGQPICSTRYFLLSQGKAQVGLEVVEPRVVIEAHPLPNTSNCDELLARNWVHGKLEACRLLHQLGMSIIGIVAPLVESSDVVLDSQATALVIGDEEIGVEVRVGGVPLLDEV